MNETELRAAILDAAGQAGEIALGHYGNVDYELKPDQSVVTAADREVDAFLRDRLATVIPEAGYVGEETVNDEATLREIATREWVWAVDPIDGTAGFTDGLDTFCVCIGLLRDGRPYAGAVFFPALKHRYSAVRGDGALYDGKSISALDAMPVMDRAVLYVDAKAHRDYRITFEGKTRSMGSTALHNLLVARGVAVGAISAAHIWDYAAAAAILEEAGGRIRHLDGTDIDWLAVLDGRHLWPPILSAPPCLWDDLAAAIDPTPAARVYSEPGASPIPQ